jgi:general secretion pathway protein K
VKRNLPDQLNEKGMALLITIMVVTLLIVVTVQFGRNMRRERVSSANLKDNGLLEAMADSGVNVAMEILARDGKTNGFDSFYDAWNLVSGRDISSLFEQGTLQLRILDLSGRLQVNSLVSAGKGEQGADAATAQKMRETLKRLLLSGNFGDIEEQQAAEIVDSLTDWIDRDDRESTFGAEAAYYRSLEHPYGCKNKPVEFIEELLLVKGISREILYGTKDHKGLASYLTVQGNDGRININTAAPLLLQAMDSRMTEESAQAMAGFRGEEKNEQRLASINWYKEIPGWPARMVFDEKTITVKSGYFRIVAVCEIHSLKKEIVVDVHREQNNRIIPLSRKAE